MPTRLAWESDTATRTFGLGGTSLPSTLVHRRLPTRDKDGGWLSMNSPRFMPRSDTELMASIFTWWDLLDSIMVAHEPNSTKMSDYMRELLLRRMVQLVRSPNVSTYCEVVDARAPCSITLVLTG